MSGLIHATWNLLAKRVPAGADFVILYSGLTCLVYAPLAYLQLSHLPPHMTWQNWAFIAGSGTVHFVYALVLQRGYQVADLGVVYPIARGTGPVFSSLAAILLLGERLTLASAGGLAFVVGGIFTLTGGIQAGNGYSDRRTGILYGVATGVCIATYTLLDAVTVHRNGVPPLLLDYLSNATRTALLLPLMLHRRQQLAAAARLHWKPALGVAVLAPLAYILVLGTLKTAPVIYVAPAREVSMLFAVLLGAVVLGEPQGRNRVTGAAFIAAGVLLLATGRT